MKGMLPADFTQRYSPRHPKAADPGKTGSAASWGLEFSTNTTKASRGNNSSRSRASRTTSWDSNTSSSRGSGDGNGLDPSPDGSKACGSPASAPKTCNHAGILVDSGWRKALPAPSGWRDPGMPALENGWSWFGPEPWAWLPSQVPRAILSGEMC